MDISVPDGYRLGINTGFAVNRYPEPEEWMRIVGEELGVSIVQLTADMLNVDLPEHILLNQSERIRMASDKYGVEVNSSFTGAFTRVNHLAHPDKEIREHWVRWFKRFVDLSVSLGCESMGSHFGIFSSKDNSHPEKRDERLSQNIENWHIIADYAKEKGLSFITWEPMSISREQGETLEHARLLQTRVNQGAPLPFKVCLDVDHGDVTSSNPKDTDPYSWLEEFAKDSPMIHLKQSSSNKGGHWPFTAENNINGRIIPEKVISTLKSQGVEKVDLLLELSFREREPVDSSVIEVLKESIEYWRTIVKS